MSQEFHSCRHFAVFGDPHGHLRLIIQLARRWQVANGIQLDGMLLCGDIGFFPDLSRLDKATKRFAEKDPEELGFAYFFRRPEPPERDQLLEETLQGDPNELTTVVCPIICCHGNHEDFEALNKEVGSSKLCAIDAFGRIELLRSGETTDLAGLTVASLGGGPEWYAGDNYRDEVLGIHVSESAANRLLGKEFDVLMSHAAPKGVEQYVADPGSQFVADVVQMQQPRYNFFAHHRGPVPPANIGETACIWHNDVNFARGADGPFKGSMEAGCMGILRWRHRDDHDFRMVDAPWFQEMNGSNWRHV